MKSLLKRRTSNLTEKYQPSGGVNNGQQQRGHHFSPPPQHARPSRTSTMPAEMPDLRFSKLDLEPRLDEMFSSELDKNFGQSPPLKPGRLLNGHGPPVRGGSYDHRLSDAPYGSQPRSPIRASQQLRDGYGTSADAYLRATRPDADAQSIASSARSRPANANDGGAFWSSAQYYASPQPSRNADQRYQVDKQHLVDSATQAMNMIDVPVKAPARYVQNAPKALSSSPQNGAKSQSPLGFMDELDIRYRDAPPRLDRLPDRLQDASLPHVDRHDAPRLRKKASNSTVMSDARSTASAPQKMRSPDFGTFDNRLVSSPPPLDLRALKPGGKMEHVSRSAEYLHPEPRRQSSRDDRMPPVQPSARRTEDERIITNSKMSQQPRPPIQKQQPQQQQQRTSPLPSGLPQPAPPDARRPVPPPQSRQRSIDSHHQQVPQPQPPQPRRENSGPPPSARMRKGSKDSMATSKDMLPPSRQEQPVPRRKQSSDRPGLTTSKPPTAIATQGRANNPPPRQRSEDRQESRQQLPERHDARQQSRNLNGQGVAKASAPAAKSRPGPAPPTASSKVRSSSKNAMTSSSDGGTTTGSSATERRRSQESNTSPDGASSDGDATDARSKPAHARQRPRRDAERMERAQSRRISTALDSDYAGERKVNATHSHSDSKASQQSTFSAKVAGSRPGEAQGKASAPSEKAEKKLEAKQEPQRPPRRAPEQPKVPAIELAQRDTRQLLLALRAADKRSDESPSLLKRVRELRALPGRRARPDLVDLGTGWECQGIGDIQTWEDERKHWRKVRETRIIKRSSNSSQFDLDVGKPAQEEEFEAKFDVYYNDLFEQIWKTTTPDVSERILSHLDVADIRCLRQTSRSTRDCISLYQEAVVARTLEPIGYKIWNEEAVKSSLMRLRFAPHFEKLPDVSPPVGKDPCPISIDELEAFLLCGDLLEEYALVSRDYVADPAAMDRAIPQLARASTRSFNRVVARLRLQPGYKVPSAPRIAGKTIGDRSPLPSNSPRISMAAPSLLRQATASVQSVYTAAQSRASSNSGSSPRHSGTQSPQQASHSPTVSLSGAPLLPDLFSPSDNAGSKSRVPSSSLSMLSPMINDTAATGIPVPASNIQAPFKPGRAPTFRVWVPPRDPTGWLSDDEIAACEHELYKSGIWDLLKKGDVVWNVAVGEQLNEGKMLFDGHFLRDLSYAYDAAGHLPNWLNVVVFSPSYWHNVIMASTPQPIVHLDVSPWREDILSSLRLVQDQVETVRPNGARYRVAKWTYRAAANIVSGQIISKMNAALEVVDEGWKGRIVIEMEGTAEAARSIVERCAGPDATLRDKRTMLANVMGDMKAASKMLCITDDYAMPNGHNGQGPRPGEPNTAPWAVMRERSRPGLIWLRPVSARERLVG